MTDTMIDRPLSELLVGDEVEHLRAGEWVPGTVEVASCGCHADIRLQDGRLARTAINDEVLRRVASSPVRIPTLHREDNTLPARAATFRRSGIRAGDRVVPTLLSYTFDGPRNYDPSQTWIFTEGDLGDSNRTFRIGRSGEDPQQVWVADIARWTEPEASHRETGPDWPRVGEYVEFNLAEEVIVGRVHTVPDDRATGLFTVETPSHGLLYPAPSMLRQPDPVAWARSLESLTEEQQQALTTLDEAEASIAATADERQAFLDRVQEVASRTANDERWCEVADGGLAKLGLSRLRTEPQVVDVDWSVEVTVQLSRFIDAEEAKEMLSERFEIPSHVEVTGPSEVEIEGSATFTVTGTTTAEEGSCVCDLVDRSVIRDYLPDWADDMSFDYEELTCDNDN